MILSNHLDPLSYSIHWENLSRKSLVIDSNFIWCLTTSSIRTSLEDSSLSLLLMPTLPSLISFVWDGFKISQQVLLPSTFLNFSPHSIIVFSLSFLGKWSSSHELSKFSPIILLIRRLITFGTISFLHLLILT